MDSKKSHSVLFFNSLLGPYAYLQFFDFVEVFCGYSFHLFDFGSDLAARCSVKNQLLQLALVLLSFLFGREFRDIPIYH